MATNCSYNSSYQYLDMKMEFAKNGYALDAQEQKFPILFSPVPKTNNAVPMVAVQQKGADLLL